MDGIRMPKYQRIVWVVDLNGLLLPLCVLRRGHWAFDSTVFSGIMVIRLRPKEKVHFEVSLSYPLIGLLTISLRRSDAISIRDLTTLRE